MLETTHGLIRALHWRKGDHWKSLIRKHAQLAVDDEQLVDAFSKDCMKCHVGVPSHLTAFLYDYGQQEGLRGHSCMCRQCRLQCCCRLPEPLKAQEAYAHMIMHFSMHVASASVGKGISQSLTTHCTRSLWRELRGHHLARETPSMSALMLQVPERYFQVLLAVHGLQNETFPNGWLTWVDWTKLDVTGAHPKDIDSTIIDEELLFIMRTSKMGDYTNVCRGAWDSGAVTSAEGLLHSYVPGSRLWRASNEQGMPVRRTRRAFAALQHECLLFGRKFKPHTISAVLDMFRHKQYATWNYTHERLTPHIYGALEDE